MELQHIERAIELARRKSADGRNGPFAAVVVREGEVVGEGWNQVTELHDPSAHGEIMAIRAAGAALGTHDLNGCALYSSCEPCPMCLAAIYWARIDRLYYAATMADAAKAGFDDSVICRELGLAWPDRSIKATQCHHHDGIRVFDAWVKNAARREY